jgi:hypothetical protein
MTLKQLLPGVATRVAIVALFCTCSFPASAIVRYIVAGMSCAEVHQALERDGTVILYRHGISGVALYDRFVKSRSSCQAGQMAVQDHVAAADTDDCRVFKCIESRRFGD